MKKEKTLFIDMNDSPSLKEKEVFQDELALRIGVNCYKKKSNRILKDFLYLYPKIVNFYRKYENDLGNDVKKSPVEIRIMKKGLILDWCKGRIPSMTLQYTKAKVSWNLGRPWQWNTCIREHRKGEGRKSVLNELFKDYRKQILKWETNIGKG